MYAMRTPPLTTLCWALKCSVSHSSTVQEAEWRERVARAMAMATLTQSTCGQLLVQGPPAPPHAAPPTHPVRAPDLAPAVHP